MQPENLDSYVYTPLPSKSQLRILRLCADSREVKTLTCELDVFEFDNPPTFEALSWCWGKKPKPGDSEILQVRKGGRIFSIEIFRNLYDALRALRKTNEDRFLWVDAVCINQNDTEERNEQVPQMDKIYGKSENTCIWLGREDKTSDDAIEFISSSVLKLWDFDQLCESRMNIKLWEALLNLMRRDWFSRRWVVQEIALSAKAEIYCGKKKISWPDFADAVSLFVRVESTTHQLSDAMKRERMYNHIPGFFGDVGYLGAALLVDATSNLFRNRVDAKSTADSDNKKSRKEPLSSLEYLVSHLTVFKASEPRDTIYALLAIAKDTTLHSHATEEFTVHDGQTEKQKRENRARGAIKRSFNKSFAMELYQVDYRLPIRDVYEKFVRFSIQKAHPVRALDIICRPWAPEIKGASTAPVIAPSLDNPDSGRREPGLPSWMPSLRRATFDMQSHVRSDLGGRMVRRNADPLVGMPEPQDRIYSAAGTTKVDKRTLKFKRRKDYCSMFVKGFVLEKIDRVFEISRLGNIPRDWTDAVEWNFNKQETPEEFWRTLVADRGPKGTNPPTYYPRACKEVMVQMGEQDILDSGYLIENCLSTIIAQFLRRVQAVIWNRHLIKTEKGRPGLAPVHVTDKAVICILYGCSVPVVLEPVEKEPEDITREASEDAEAITELKKAFLQRLRDRVSKRRRQEEGNHRRKAATEQETASKKSREAQVQAPTLLTRRRRQEEIISFAFLLYTAYSYFRGYSWVLLLIARHTVGLPSMRYYASQMQTQQQTAGAAAHRQGIPTWFPSLIADYQIVTHFICLLGLWRTLQCLGEILERTVSWTSQRLHATQRKVNSSIVLLQDITSEGVEHLIQWSTQRKKTKECYWKLIGECYVHGMMGGEAIKLQHTDDIKPQIFEIR